MPTHLAFLRAVNIGKRQYPMAELRAALLAAGYDDVATHIQTGNVRLSSPSTDRAAVEAALEAVLEADRGFAVPVVVLSPEELAAVVHDADQLAADHPAGVRHYISLLKHRPSAEGIARIQDQEHPGETAVVRGRAVHLLYDKLYHEARLSNAAVEKALGVATNRNATVVRTLAVKWGV
ncbi:MAG TPA: DUF1697 domain-containing protein [Nocardioidaceae bacterium]|nr:DUF1697 domain-containing protein [Nocardioidaceae bacterium]